MKPVSKTPVGGPPKLARLRQAARAKDALDLEAALQPQDELRALASTTQDLAAMTKFTRAMSRAEIVARCTNVEESALTRFRIDKILNCFDKLPTLDRRPMSELIEYDALGLPK